MYSVTDFPDVKEIRLSVCDATDFREAAEVVKSAALRLPGIDAVGIYAFDCRTDFHLVSYAGVSPAFAENFSFFASDSPQAKLVINGAPFYRKVSELPPERAAFYERENIKAIAIYPIKHKQHVVGSLHVGTRSLLAIPPEQAEQMEMFVASLANAIARITYEAMVHRAYDEVEQRVKERTKELTAVNKMLRESEAKFRSIAESSHVMISITQNQRLVYVNPYLCTLSGYTREELLSMNVMELIHPDHRELALDRITRRMRGEPMLNSYEYRMTSKSGKMHWVEVTPVQIEWNGAPALAIISIDIHERKLANESLQRSEFILKQAGTMAHLGAWELEFEEAKLIGNKKLHWSEQVYRIFGVEPGTEDVTGKFFFNKVHPDDRMKVKDAVKVAISERKPYQIEHRIIRPDGVERTVVEYAQVAYNESGMPLRMIGAVQDITERKKAEHQIRENELRFRHLADSMPQLVWTANSDGKVDYFNERIAEFDGAVRDCDGSWSWTPGIHPEDRERTIEAWQNAVKAGKGYQVEHRIRLKSGEYRWHLTRARPHCDGAGAVLKWYGTTTDIHGEREAQQALKDAHRRKDMFLAMLGHELRNPLAPIRNAVEILSEVELSDEPARRAREMLERQVSHISRLLDDLLDVSRISRGKIQLKSETLDLVELLQHLAKDYQISLKNSGVKFETELPGEAVMIHGDSARIKQIVDNLLNNAVKFTNPGGYIRLSLMLDGLQSAQITVEDTGIGIEKENLEHIFETFSQAEHSVARSRGGLGLGLSLVKGLVEMHGGRVTAESKGLGNGATFHIWLPTTVHRATVPAHEVKQKIRRCQRVLIIEDNIDAAESLQILLSMRGHDVQIAFDGREGIETARAFQPEVIFCDIGLPNDMDGYAVAREIRNTPALASTKLIAMTGYGQESDRRRALDAGFDKHITKPADPKTIQQLLENC